MRDPLPRYPGYALRRAAMATASELGWRLAPLGFRQADVSALILIEQNPSITASALGRQLDIQRPNMVPLLKKLDDAGLLDKSPIDGKSVGLKLTAEGKKRLTEAQNIIEAFENELWEKIPEPIREDFLPALNALWR